MVAVPIPMSGATAPALDENGLKVTAIRVNHGPVKPAYGYRFDYAGRSISVSGDTAFYPPFAQAALGSDVVVHEGQRWLETEGQKLAQVALPPFPPAPMGSLE